MLRRRIRGEAGTMRATAWLIVALCALGALADEPKNKKKNQKKPKKEQKAKARARARASREIDNDDVSGEDKDNEEERRAWQDIE